jgi:phosphoserine phosphatase
MIEPVAARLNIPIENIFANTIVFDKNGEYESFDATEPTSKDGGKPQVVQMYVLNYYLLC